MATVNGNKPVLIADSIIQAIEIKENSEPLFDLSQQTVIPFGKPPHFSNNRVYTKVRTSVYQKLLTAQSFLPFNLKLCLFEGYRDLVLQQELFRNRYRYVEEQSKYQKRTHESIFLEATILTSPVYNLDGSKNIPPHSTGGAVDLYLIDQNHQVVDMGMYLDEHPPNKVELAQTNSSIISQKAATYRNIMSSALQRAGFINYATEYWHWSYGDRYWAYQTQHNHAIYGEV